MARLRKEPDERKAELVETAGKLFAKRGYATTSVSDIVKATGVAQGTFYWYFKSKEEILEAVAEIMAERILGGVEEVIEERNMKADEKLWRIFESMLSSVESGGIIVEEFHSPKFSRYHDKMARFFIKRLIPVLSRVISEGVEQGVFDTPSPDMAAVFILAPGLYTDEDIPIDQSGSIEHFSTEYIDIIGRVLGAPSWSGNFKKRGK